MFYFHTLSFFNHFQKKEKKNRLLITSLILHSTPCEFILSNLFWADTPMTISVRETTWRTSLFQKRLQQQSTMHIENFFLRSKLISFSERKLSAYLSIPLSSSCFPPSPGLFLSIPLSGLGRMFYIFHLLYSWFFSLLLRPLQPLPSLFPVLLIPFPLPGQFLLLPFFLISISFFFPLNLLPL